MYRKWLLPTVLPMVVMITAPTADAATTSKDGGDKTLVRVETLLEKQDQRAHSSVERLNQLLGEKGLSAPVESGLIAPKNFPVLRMIGKALDKGDPDALEISKRNDGTVTTVSVRVAAYGKKNGKPPKVGELTGYSETWLCYYPSLGKKKLKARFILHERGDNLRALAQNSVGLSPKKLRKQRKLLHKLYGRGTKRDGRASVRSLDRYREQRNSGSSGFGRVFARLANAFR